MAVNVIDAKGLKCPQPTIQMTIKALKMKRGDILEVVADCSTFENDVKNWCRRNNKPLLWLRDEGNGVKRCQVQF
ncbi:MAG TPA: sulfurtransferase TusA family protein [Dissulfurispiraceae bacterium]|nr:sulfurtransferase TusA family protein [Dissulfurispiraceae bacterium]